MFESIIYLFYYVIVSLVVSYLLRPKPQNAAPQNPEGVPSIADDAIIPVLFGTRELSNNNVLWWGDTLSVGIVRKSGK